MQGLEHLSLKHCEIGVPSMFNGFSLLKSLILSEVYITATMLQRILTSCPLLEQFTLTGYEFVDFTEGNTCTFVELFKCLPSVQVVNISWFHDADFYAGVRSQKLPTSLAYLRILVLQMVYCNEQTFTTLLDPEDYSGLNLDHLKELEITNFRNHALEMEFLKLIMAKSPVLKIARIELSASVSVDAEVMMLLRFVKLAISTCITSSQAHY
ncbi:unnamed protein product [Lactuca virosa]|uniref:FBD domain-containing protein n=1 Tax=Lactuca virosa TaxID=75947 RepID=A0AAU9MHV5_9ASTR|nr:unnamed protein product [Lactuca virosa]CAH1425081.1 unnamed protein product [Lactuca virosa]